MYLRSYRTKADPKKIPDYERFETTEGIPMVRGMKGCVAAGFGRIVEEPEPSYVFFSVWRSKKDCDEARATPTWKTVAGKLEAMRFTVGGDRAEHVELRGFSGDAAR